MSESIKVDQYTVLRIEDAGQYGFKLVEGWEGREGFKPNFCKREFKKGSGEKTMPVSIKLGAEVGIAEVVLLSALFELTGKVYVEKPADELPF